MNREQIQHACDLVNRNNERMDAGQMKCKVGKPCNGRCIPQSHKCDSKASHSGWLIYFEGRRTPVAVSASDRSEAISKARGLKKRGGEGVVSARHANEQERAQAAKGKWIRTGPNGEKPGESKLRGQGPKPKAYKGDESDFGES